MPDSLLRQGYDAVLVAVGAHKGLKMGITGEGSARVIDGIGFLRHSIFSLRRFQGQVGLLGERGSNLAKVAFRAPFERGDVLNGRRLR